MYYKFSLFSLFSRVEMATRLACTVRLILSVPLHDPFQLIHDIRTIKRLFIHQLLAFFAIPSQSIYMLGSPDSLDHEADGVSEAYRSVGSVSGKEEHLSFADGYVLEFDGTSVSNLVLVMANL